MKKFFEYEDGSPIQADAYFSFIIMLVIMVGAFSVGFFVGKL